MSKEIRKIKQYDKKRFKKRLIGFIQRCDPFQDFEVDNDGRLVLFTDLFLWDDFTIRDGPQKEESVNQTNEDDNDDISIEEEFKLDSI